MLAALDSELIGLVPVKRRIREITAYSWSQERGR